MNTYRITLNEQTYKEFKVEANSRVEAEQKYDELFEKGFFNGPLVPMDDSARLDITTMNPDDPDLDIVISYDQALEYLAFAKMHEPFVTITWNRSDIVSALTEKGIEPTAETIETIVASAKNLLSDMSIEKGWDIIETIIEEKSLDDRSSREAKSLKAIAEQVKEAEPEMLIGSPSKEREER